MTSRLPLAAAIAAGSLLTTYVLAPKPAASTRLHSEVEIAVTWLPIALANCSARCPSSPTPIIPALMPGFVT